MWLFPQMPLEGCQLLPLVKVWPRVDAVAGLSSVLGLPGAEL
jgi:hypothetical protein